MSPTTLVQLLTMGDARFLRLQYVSASAGQAGAGGGVQGGGVGSMYYTAVGQTPALFAAAFPNFEAWAADAAAGQG